jgi:ectoine hydroxylase-related dioxygenase (phytanoyl-CoA dioxygenase family)
MNLNKLNTNFKKNGYIITSIPSLINKINKINIKIDLLIKKKDFKTNPKAFHYNKSPRIVEAWKDISEIRKVAYNKILLKVLKTLKNNREPIPFSTINFMKGTEQPMHSDYIHFATLPHNYLLGVWIAMEDIHKDSGPLAIVEKSHKFPILSNEKLNLKIPKNEIELKKNYTAYEIYIKNFINKNKYEIKELPIKKGDIIIWDANLLHGALKIKNKKLTRKSMVLHYHFAGCTKYYNPIYSMTSKKLYALRDLKKLKIKNINEKN